MLLGTLTAVVTNLHETDSPSGLGERVVSVFFLTYCTQVKYLTYLLLSFLKDLLRCMKYVCPVHFRKVIYSLSWRISSSYNTWASLKSVRNLPVLFLFFLLGLGCFFGVMFLFLFCFFEFSSPSQWLRIKLKTILSVRAGRRPSCWGALRCLADEWHYESEGWCETVYGMTCLFGRWRFCAAVLLRHWVQSSAGVNAFLLRFISCGLVWF